MILARERSKSISLDDLIEILWDRPPTAHPEFSKAVEAVARSRDRGYISDEEADILIKCIAAHHISPAIERINSSVEDLFRLSPDKRHRTGAGVRRVAPDVSQTGHEGDSPSEQAPVDKPTPSEIVERLPEDEKGIVLQSFTALSIEHPLAARITSEHVGDLISLEREQTRLEYDDRKQFGWIMVGFTAFVTVVAVGFAVFLAIKEQNALLTDLITKVVIVLGGFGAGWGASSLRRRS